MFALPLALAAAMSTGPVTLDHSTADRVIELARQKYARTSDQLPTNAYPELIDSRGRWTTVSNTNQPGWTQGFYPGILWQLSELTGDAAWQEKAKAWTHNLEVQKTNRTTHDLGFKLFDSFGPEWRITHDPHAKAVLLEAAASLASRYHEKPGAISCCDWNREWHLPVVSDTMMNLELLFWGAENGGDPAWKEMALNHALLNATDLVRPDGSSFHVVDYDPASGRQLSRGTYQGDADSSTWSRGHVWEIYGFTVAYRYTHDARMLAAAVKTADWYLAHLPSDMVPNWDFDATSQHPDSSAAAAAASALIELSQYVDATNGQRYRDAALRTIASLSDTPYLDVNGSGDSVLLRGTADLPHNKGIDTGLVYGDYYLLQAIQRSQALQPTSPPASPPASTPSGDASGSPSAPASPTETSSPTGASSPQGCASTGATSLAVLTALPLLARRLRKKTR